MQDEFDFGSLFQRIVLLVFNTRCCVDTSDGTVMHVEVHVDSRVRGTEEVILRQIIFVTV